MGSDSKVWSARFDEPVSELMQRFNASIPFDRRLLSQELRASSAYARMLGAAGIISADDSAAIVAGLEKLGAAEEFAWRIEDEDVHSAVERLLTEKIGEAGKRLHTGRSRNDQVATVTRLWLREQIDDQLRLLAAARGALLRRAKEHVDTVIPGMTHLQVAQPTTLAHHLHAYSCMMARDADRLAQCRARVNLLPLGAAALAGTSYPLQPEQVASDLGFDGLCPNTMDAVSDRDFAVEYASCAAQIMAHLSRLSEEIVVWSSQPFAFVQLADSFSTGSSIMPQKRNPDAAELVRGKAGRVYGSLVSLLTVVKAQPLAYNKDNQEDKEALFDAVDTVAVCLEVMAGMVDSMKFDADAMAAAAERGYATATELADLLVREGMAFRDAHAKVAQIVKAAEKEGHSSLSELSDDFLREAVAGVDVGKVRQALDLRSAVKARTGHGAPGALAGQIDADLASLQDLD